MKPRKGAEAPMDEQEEAAAVESVTAAAVENAAPIEAAPAPVVLEATPAPEPPPVEADAEEEDGMKGFKGLNPLFLGGAVQRSREKVERLFDELLDGPQLRVLDQIIGNLEHRKTNPAAKRDYKPGTWSASGT